MYVAAAAEKLAPSTMQVALAAFNNYEQSRGVPKDARAVQAAGLGVLLKRVQAAKATAAAAAAAEPGAAGGGGPGGGEPQRSGGRVQAPLTVPLLRLLLGLGERRARAGGQAEADSSCDAAWLAGGFYGLLRRSELLAVLLGDVAELRGPGGESLGVSLFIRRSKGDPEGKGATVVIPNATRGGVRAAEAVRRHAAAQVAAGAGPGSPLFAPLVKVGGSKEVFTTRLRELLSEAAAVAPELQKIDPMLLAAHSLRRGGAVALYEAGVSREEIKRQGRWRSDAIDAYLQPSAIVRLSEVAKA